MVDNFPPWPRGGVGGGAGNQGGSGGDARDGERWGGADEVLISSPTTHPLWWGSCQVTALFAPRVGEPRRRGRLHGSQGRDSRHLS